MTDAACTDAKEELFGEEGQRDDATGESKDESESDSDEEREPEPARDSKDAADLAFAIAFRRRWTAQYLEWRQLLLFLKFGKWERPTAHEELDRIHARLRKSPCWHYFMDNFREILAEVPSVKWTASVAQSSFEFLRVAGAGGKTESDSLFFDAEWSTVEPLASGADAASEQRSCDDECKVEARSHPR